jgi:UDPglucose--hexose-1-phosphate uridylyltransferase
VSVFRKNMVTNDWVIFAPNRLKRPVELKPSEVDNIKILADRPKYAEKCPFCRGNESPEDKEVLRIDSDEGWHVRILENKYSVVDRTIDPERSAIGLQKEVQGFGIHDVIIDHPLHNINIALMDRKETLCLLDAYIMRYAMLQSNPRVKHVVLFKNQGITAGGSLEHPHSQICGLPIVPFDTQIRLREMERYYDLNNRCLLCNMVRDEIEEKVRIFYEDGHFVCLVPYADLSPYHFWIIPKMHSPSFFLIGDEEKQSLADCMKTAFRKLYVLLRNPDYNLVVQSLSRFDREKEYFHWYISVIPHIKRKGGLEYAGGLYVNPVMPEVAAEELRDVEADPHW